MCLLLANLLDIKILTSSSSRTLFHDWKVDYWIRQTKIREELVVGEFQQCNVELGESAHHFVINVKRQSLIELVRLDPSYLLAHYFNSIIDALDGEE